MIVDNIWEEQFSILSYHMDPKRKAHITAICNFLQEGAGAHAAHAGFGFEAMMNRNQVWVLSRLKIEIEKYPTWNDQVKLKTWSRGREGIFYVRDFQIEDNYKNVIISATSSWAALNIKKRRPEIVEGLEEGLHSQKDKFAIGENLEKLPELTNLNFMRNRHIEYTDIDLVYHVNNVKYIEIIINSFPPALLMNKDIKSLEINYLGEAKYGEELVVNNDQLGENSFLVSMKEVSSQKEVCRAKLIWQ